MALRKTLGNRLMSLAAASAARPPARPLSLVRRLIAAATPPRRVALPVGDDLLERINREMLSPSSLAARSASVSVEKTRKLMKALEIERVRTKLSGMERSMVSYSEFIGICREAVGPERGVKIARDLDEAGAVIALGEVVFLRPAELAKAIEGVLAPTAMANKDDQNKRELKEMEKKKAEIDEKAEAQVRRELWFGLGLLLLQTAGFLRLTFWELSWDVMEPICFYVTSTYFMAGYAFFLWTSRNPSFEGFFQSRFATKQRRLMEAHKFDIQRFHELKRNTKFFRRPWHLEEFSSSCAPPCDCHRGDSAWRRTMNNTKIC